MFSILLGASALLPALLLVTYFHRRDVFPEPGSVLWRTFGLGVLTIFPAISLALPLDSLAEQLGNPLAYGFASAFLGAAIPEELAKFLVLYFYAARHMEFDEPMDGIVYGATASLGFAALENVLYVAEGGLGVAAVRAVLSVPGHALFGAVMGYFVGQAKFTEGDRTPLLTRALCIPILLHGFYNTPLLAASRFDDPTGSVTGCATVLLLPMAPAIVFGGWMWIAHILKQMRTEQLSREVPTVPTVVEPASHPPIPLPVGATVQEPSVAPPQTSPSRATQDRASGGVWGWLLTLGGAILVCCGGLVSLAVVVGAVLGEEGMEDLIAIAIGGVVLGVLPTLIGLIAFFTGIRRLNRAKA